MFRNKQQNKALHALITDLGIDQETKEELVYQFTKGRESSSSKMLVFECQALINHLNVLKNEAHATNRRVTNQTVSSADKAKSQKMRRKILSTCHEMNWRKNGALDWPRINAFLLKSGYLQKPLNDYTAQELPKLVTQFDQVLKSYYDEKNAKG